MKPPPAIASPPPQGASVPPLGVTHRAQGTTQTVTITGEIDISCAREVQVVLDRALAARPETLLLDLSGIDFCDSSGIHLVFQTERRAKLQRTRFLLIPPVGGARRVFELCSVADEVAVVPSGD